MKSYIYLTATN